MLTKEHYCPGTTNTSTSGTTAPPASLFNFCCDTPAGRAPGRHASEARRADGDRSILRLFCAVCGKTFEKRQAEHYRATLYRLVSRRCGSSTPRWLRILRFHRWFHQSSTTRTSSRTIAFHDGANTMASARRRLP